MYKNHALTEGSKHEAHYSRLMSLNMSVPDPSASAREHLEFLSGSAERLDLLAELQARSLSLVELGERAEVSDKTVQNLLEAGVERDWITEDIEDECYTLTAAGDLVLQAYLDTEVLDRELLSFFTMSTTRLRVLEYLKTGSLSAVELNDRISVSDPTVYRALHSLEERGLVDWSQTPELTPTGVDVFEAYRELVDTLRWVMDHIEVLNALGETARTLPARRLAQSNGEVIVNSMAHPDAVLNHFEDRIEDISPKRIRGVLPSMCAFVDRVRRPLLERGAEVEVVADEAVLDVARTSYPQVLASIEDSESVELFVHPEKLRFGLAILNGSVFLFIYADQSLIACLETTDETLCAWAAGVYQTHQRAAQQSKS